MVTRVSTLPCGRAFPKRGTPLSETAIIARIQTLMGDLDAFLAERKLKRSEVRQKILEVIVRDARHFRVPDLLPRLARRFPDIGRATVYRALPILVDAGILREGPRDSEGQVYFELADDEHHDHIVCLDCHEIFEFHDEGIERRQQKITTALDFSAEEHRHVIYAHCTRSK